MSPLSFFVILFCFNHNDYVNTIKEEYTHEKK